MSGRSIFSLLGWGSSHVHTAPMTLTVLPSPISSARRRPRRPGVSSRLIATSWKGYGVSASAAVDVRELNRWQLRPQLKRRSDGRSSIAALRRVNMNLQGV